MTTRASNLRLCVAAESRWGAGVGGFIKPGWLAVRTWQASGPTAFEEDRKTLPPRLWMVHLGEANQFRNKVF